MNKHLNKIKKSHFLLVLIIVSGLIIQLFYYASIHQKIIMYSDSWTYLNAAKAMQKNFYIDVYRPPFYMIIILFSAALLSWKKYYIGVIVIQMAFTVLDSILIYKISRIVSKSKLVGFLTVLIINLSISVYGWNFMIMTESLAIFLVTLTTFFTLKYFESNKKIYLAYLFITITAAIFTKPFFIFLPVLFVFVFLFRRVLMPIPDFKIHFKVVSICFSAVYLVILAYSALNLVENGFFGITSVSSVNSFGKVLQYQLHEKGDNPELIKDINTAYASTEKEKLVEGYFLEPWKFINKYNWKKNNYNDIGEFSSGIIKKEFLIYTAKSIVLTYKIIMSSNNFSSQIALRPLNYNEPLAKIIDVLYLISSVVGKLSFILLIIILIYFILFITLKLEIIKEHFHLFVITLFILYHYLVSAFFSYGDYFRLVAPSYVIFYFLIINISITILGYIQGNLSKLIKC